MADTELEDDMRRRRKVQEVETDQPAEETQEVGEQKDEGTVPKNKAPRPNSGWQNVVTDTLHVGNPSELARRLRDELTLEGDRSSYGAILESLDRSARNLDDSRRLHRAAKVEEKKFEIASSKRLEVMRSNALEELMDEYRAKKRPSPTQKDVHERMISNWPDEYGSIQLETERLHSTVRSLETLAEAWSSRCADLRIMANKSRTDSL